MRWRLTSEWHVQNLTWGVVWAAVLVVIAIVFWITTEDDPELKARRAAGAGAKGILVQLEPLRNIQVWRFSIYYFFVFGAFVALALWLPRYLVGAYDLDIKSAGMIAAMYSIPASIFRAYGGHVPVPPHALAQTSWIWIASAATKFRPRAPRTARRRRIRRSSCRIAQI